MKTFQIKSHSTDLLSVSIILVQIYSQISSTCSSSSAAAD